MVHFSVSKYRSFSQTSLSLKNNLSIFHDLLRLRKMIIPKNDTCEKTVSRFLSFYEAQVSLKQRCQVARFSSTKSGFFQFGTLKIDPKITIFF